MAAQHYLRLMTTNLHTYACYGDKAFVGINFLCSKRTSALSLVHRLVQALVLALTFLISACASSPGQQSTVGDVESIATTSSSETTDSTLTTLPETTSQTGNTTTQAPANLESGLTRMGTIQPAGITEASGMAFSGQQNNLLWVINDSGNDATLFAITTRGNTVASYEIAADNRDWEDLAQFNVNGESFLLIADIGDNLRNQSSYRLHLLPEPIPDTRNNAAAGPALQPLVSFDLMYEDGAHNAEAAAVADDGMLYIITKDDSPAVYTAPIREALDSAIANPSNTVNGQAIPLLASRIGAFQQPSLSAADSLVNLISGVALNAITALDIDNNLGEAWFITYRGIYRLPAAQGGWPTVLLSKPRKLASHGLNQAEAMAVSPQNEGVFVTSEGRAAPLLRLVP